MLGKAFVGTACVGVAGAFGFYFSRVYIESKKHEHLAARERIYNTLANAPETEETPLAYTKAYRDEVKRKRKEIEDRARAE